MCLPIVIIFEHHWDPIPKLVVRDLLPDLYKKGYETFSLEAPQDLSSNEIVARHQSGLKEDLELNQQAKAALREKTGIECELSSISFTKLMKLLQYYVHSKEYAKFAEKIKKLPASLILKQVFEKAKELSISLKGVDIDSKDFDAMMSPNLLTRMGGIEDREDCRIPIIFHNLLKLQTQKKEGVIFVCGAFHAERLINTFKKQDLQDRVLYYFPHSGNHCGKDVDIIKDLTTNDTLPGHTYFLSQEKVKSFVEKVIGEVIEKTSYTREILDVNSHSQFLSAYFKTNVRAFLRPGYHVDAFVDISEAANIQKHLTAAGLETHPTSLDNRAYLVIPNINTKDTADRIRKMGTINFQSSHLSAASSSTSSSPMEASSSNHPSSSS